jgi:tripartite-type tricarboxylate transporter receptor subunit TctC
MKRSTFAVFAAALLAALPAAQAADYPTKTIRMVIAFSPGGPSDILSRLIGSKLSERMGQAFVFDNRPGAGGTLGAFELVNAKPDGYTLAQLPQSVFRIPHMQKVQFDTLKDFTWIACLTGYTFGLVVRADSPIRTVKELVDYAKANPEKFTYGSPGVGTSPHLVVEEFAAKAGVKMQHVPFKGVADGLQALIGGHTMGHSDSTGWGPMVEAGRLRLLATYGSKRTKRWPNIPTLEELGYQTVSDSPFGVCGPKGMDPAVVKTIHDAFKKVIEDPAVLSMLEKYDQNVIYLDTAAYTKFAHETFVAEKATIERLGMSGPK